MTLKLKEQLSAGIKIGIPVALQDGFIQVAFMIITVIANSRGCIRCGGTGGVADIKLTIKPRLSGYKR